MKPFLFALLGLLHLFPVSVYAQEEAAAFTIILTPGDSLRETGNLVAAIEAYKKSVSAGNIYAPNDNSIARSIYCADNYNLACALSRMGQQDTALKYLERSVLDCTDSSGEALSDPDLMNIRSAAGWAQLEDLLVNRCCNNKTSRLKDLAYAKTLWHLGAIDQAYYKDIEIAEKKTGKTSTVVLALWELKRRLNEENQQRLEKLIQDKGWPKISAVGAGPARTAFLIVQHADLARQQKYLPVIESLCKIGEAQWEQYALMYDRIQTDLGKPQRYGSQVFFNAQTQQYELFPLENKAQVEALRKKLGMQPLGEYLKEWDISWPDEN